MTMGPPWKHAGMGRVAPLHSGGGKNVQILEPADDGKDEKVDRQNAPGWQKMRKMQMECGCIFF